MEKNNLYSVEDQGGQRAVQRTCQDHSKVLPLQGLRDSGDGMSSVRQYRR